MVVTHTQFYNTKLRSIRPEAENTSALLDGWVEKERYLFATLRIYIAKSRPSTAGAVKTAAMFVIATIPNIAVGYEADCQDLPAEVKSCICNFPW